MLRGERRNYSPPVRLQIIGRERLCRSGRVFTCGGPLLRLRVRVPGECVPAVSHDPAPGPGDLWIVRATVRRMDRNVRCVRIGDGP
jgi:hypothetical protein